MTFSPEHLSHVAEAVLHSAERLRARLPETYRAHFDTLRQEIRRFCDAHNLPTELLRKPDELLEHIKLFPLPDLERFALLLKRFVYLIEHKKPMTENLPEHLEEVAEQFHLREQYQSQMDLLEAMGMLEDGGIEGVDGHHYPVPTLEQVAQQIYERREELEVKRQQGFDKLVIVPFGVGLLTLLEGFRRFVRAYKKQHPAFARKDSDERNRSDRDGWDPLSGEEKEWRQADEEERPLLSYFPVTLSDASAMAKRRIVENLRARSAPSHRHLYWQTKREVLEDRALEGDPLAGWRVQLFESGRDMFRRPCGIAPIPRIPERLGSGERRWFKANFLAGKKPESMLTRLMDGRDRRDSTCYYLETGLTPEDWICAFLTHLQETGKPLDDADNPEQSGCYLLGACFGEGAIWSASWERGKCQVRLKDKYHPSFPRVSNRIGARTSVVI